MSVVTTQQMMPITYITLTQNISIYLVEEHVTCVVGQRLELSGWLPHVKAADLHHLAWPANPEEVGYVGYKLTSILAAQKAWNSWSRPEISSLRAAWLCNQSLG